LRVKNLYYYYYYYYYCCCCYYYISNCPKLRFNLQRCSLTCLAST